MVFDEVVKRKVTQQRQVVCADTQGQSVTVESLNESAHATSEKGDLSPQKESLVLLQFLLLALYLILLSVLYLIQLGIGLFCLIFLASLTFFLNVLMEPYKKQSQVRNQREPLITHRITRSEHIPYSFIFIQM